MKLLYFTDTHIRGTSPKNRLDDFPSALEDKFIEIIDFIEREDIDYVIHGGDLFDRPDISISTMGRFADILRKFPVPFYVVSGNHDIYGHNPETTYRTMLGLLGVLDIVKIISPEDIINIEKSGIHLQITGQPYVYDIDSEDSSHYYIKKKGSCDYYIHIVHGMLLDKPFVPGIPYTLVEDIFSTEADITLSGHYHRGFKTIENNGKYFVNPGSLVRITNSLDEIKRKPKGVVIHLDKERGISIDDFYLKSAAKGEDILDRNEMESSIFKNERMLEFKQEIEAAVAFEKLDINDLLIQVSTADGIEDRVKKEALRRIGLVQMREGIGG